MTSAPSLWLWRMRFQTIYVSRENRYALVRDTLSGSPFLSIPVSNRLADYEEYYALTEDELSQLAADPAAAIAFAGKCGRREMDDRLLLPPGSDRGVY